MASDHQTQAGKPQPLNPKVGTMGGGCEEQAKLIPQTQFLFCKVGMAFAFLGLPHSTPAPLWASVSPICMRGLILTVPPQLTTGMPEFPVQASHFGDLSFFALPTTLHPMAHRGPPMADPQCHLKGG